MFPFIFQVLSYMLGFQGTLGKLPNITGPSSSLKGLQRDMVYFTGCKNMHNLLSFFGQKLYKIVWDLITVICVIRENVECRIHCNL
jgi:hypothetical protein